MFQDPQVAQNFAELQSKFIDNNDKLKQLQQQATYKMREKRKGELTLKELEDVPDSTPTYFAAGKIYISSSVEDCKTKVKGNLQKLESDGKTLQNTAAYISNQLVQLEGQMKELLTKNE
eukprot:GCRY01001309.1.p1 GENE.GCRY01001309.1~~GCRY01001309.1.p1  ORF type:complete len:119 (+),score=11.81 GCRY01001309.1:178-534(+)